MQRSQRGRDNAALNLAVALGNALRLPVLAAFGLTADYPGAQRRHDRFLVEGLRDARDDLAARDEPLIVRLGRPDEVALAVASEVRPTIVVGDENSLRIGQAWRARGPEGLEVPFRLIDVDVIVPTSLFPKQEYAARTIRPKIHMFLSEARPGFRGGDSNAVVSRIDPATRTDHGDGSAGVLVKFRRWSTTPCGTPTSPRWPSPEPR